MRTRKSALLALLIVSVGGYAIASLLGDPQPPQQQHASPQQVVEGFLKAVDRGELTLFTYTLDRSFLVPRRVEYLYDLDNPLPTLTVYCDLKEAVPVPGQPALEVRAVTAVLGYGYSIMETRAHVFGKNDSPGSSEP